MAHSKANAMPMISELTGSSSSSCQVAPEPIILPRMWEADALGTGPKGWTMSNSIIETCPGWTKPECLEARVHCREPPQKRQRLEFSLIDPGQNLTFPAETFKHPRQRYFLELFSGDEGLTAAVRAEGYRSAPGIDIVKHGEICNLECPAIQRRILQWIGDGRIWCVWLGTPCSVWCIARKGVRNVHSAETKDRLGVKFALFSAEVVRACLHRRVYFAVENPQTSKLWKFGPMERALSDPRVNKMMFHACAYHAESKKPTVFMGTLPGMNSLMRRCPGTSATHTHTRLCGTTKGMFNGMLQQVSRTALAGSYAKDLCLAIARLIAKAAHSRQVFRCAEGVADQEEPFLAELHQALEEADPNEKMEVPLQHLATVSAGWRGQLKKLGLSDIAKDMEEITPAGAKAKAKAHPRGCRKLPAEPSQMVIN